MRTAWNQIKHPNSEAHDAYEKTHQALRAKAYEDANTRLPQILGNIHEGWSRKALFCGPIDKQALQDAREWTSESKELSLQTDSTAQTFGRFNWNNTLNNYDSIKSRFETAIYAGNKLAALSIGGWRNWHGDTNGKDVTTNCVCIDVAEVAPQRGLILPGLSLVAIAEAARSYARLTNRDVFALNGPSERMTTMLDAVGFPKMKNLDLYMMPVEDLDNVWENLAQYLKSPNEALPHQKLLGNDEIRGLLELE